ncbi:hypothetical protein WMF31_40595 [Sorangium sp. So ce1036]|uniref:hypothetical protein n=1 Tax=Sorangium sp. So ce1036 TaxID=3133328 RepID=UPI003F0E4D43
MEMSGSFNRQAAAGGTKAVVNRGPPGDEACPVVQRWRKGPVHLVRTGIEHVRGGLR